MSVEGIAAKYALALPSQPYPCQPSQTIRRLAVACVVITNFSPFTLTVRSFFLKFNRFSGFQWTDVLFFSKTQKINH
jgi:hypothetical protein